MDDPKEEDEAKKPYEALLESLGTVDLEWIEALNLRANLRLIPYLSNNSNLDDGGYQLTLFLRAFLRWAFLTKSAPRDERLLTYTLDKSETAFKKRIKSFTSLYDRNESPEFFGALASSYLLAFALKARSTDKSAAEAATTRDLDQVIRNEAALESIAWRSVSEDLAWLRDYETPHLAARRLVSKNLWNKEIPPKGFDNAVLEFKLSDTSKRNEYQIWHEWFDRRKKGQASGFHIPGDKYRREDKALARRIASEELEELLGKDALSANNTLTEWLEEARERAAQNLDATKKTKGDDRATRIASVRKVASPEFTETEGKADASPHTKLDQPKFGGDLADLPTALQSLARSLASSLPSQASPLVRTGLAEYENELKLRGPRPILGLLHGQIDGIAYEVFTKASLSTSNDPADWEFIDESEWGPGAARMFPTLFTYHRDLMEHFPLDETREKVLRETEIDEAAATGKNLSEPFETLAVLVRDLHSQGMATDNILSVIEKLAEYSNHVANLPTPPLDLPADYITPQKRTALNNTGLLYEFYAFLGSSASMAAWVQANPVLMQQLYDAAMGLSKLIL